MRRLFLFGSAFLVVAALVAASGGFTAPAPEAHADASVEATNVATPQTPTLMGDPKPKAYVPPRDPVIEASAPVTRFASRHEPVTPLLANATVTKTPILFADIKPRQVTLDFDVSQLVSYKKKASAVLFRPSELVHRDLLATIATHGIPEYPGDKVHQYLNDQANKQGKVFEWVPLRPSDAERWRKGGGTWPYRDVTARDFGGSVRSSGHYTKLVPEEVLERVETINRYVPEAVFYVSDIERYKDPFLCVGVGEFPMIVIAVWDEPGFTCPPLARVPELIVRK